MSKSNKSNFIETTVEDALGLSAEELYIIDLKIDLGQLLKHVRTKVRKLSQEKLGSLLDLKQPRIALMEAGDPSVSIEAYVTAFYKLGKEMEAGKIFSRSRREDASVVV